MLAQEFSAAWRGLLVGAATGLRSTVGMATIAWVTPRDTGNGWSGQLAGRRARGLTAAAVLGEVLVDKYPHLPSRLNPAVLAGRTAIGMTAAAALSRRDGVRPLVPVVCAAAGVVAAAAIGVRWRRANSDGKSRYAAALAEDAAAVGMAMAAGAPRRARKQSHRSPNTRRISSLSWVISAE